MEENRDPSCSFAIGASILASLIFLVGWAVQYFQDPRNVEGFFDVITGLGICLGAALLVLFILSINAAVSAEYRARLQPMSQEYPVRCAVGKGLGAQGAGEILSIYLLLSITNYGISLRPIPKKYAWDGVYADNESRYYKLSDGSPEPIILARGHTRIYYLLGNRQVDMFPERHTEQSQSLPADIGSSHLEIRLVYSALLKGDNLKEIIYKETLQGINFVVLDMKGREDEGATHELYNDIFEYLKPIDTSNDDDGYDRYRPPWYY